MEKITINDFAKIDIRVGVVLEAAEVEGSEKLIRQVVDFGSEIGKKIIFSGIKKWYRPEDLVGRHLPYVVNLEPRPMPSYVETSEGKIREESQGMLMAASSKDEDGNEYASLLQVDEKVSPGSRVI